MDAFFSNVLHRVRMISSAVADLSGVSRWIGEHTSHPQRTEENWSFHGHEFQIDIANDTAHKQCTMKCSQVGLSELTVRVALAISAMITSSTSIYTLPTTSFSRKFVKGRVDPVIKHSNTLRELLDRDVDSSEMKKIGDSMIYFAGTFGQSSAISIPAQFVLQDEIDFCNPMVLTTFASRLGHNEDGGYLRKFSTPTVNGRGIAHEYASSSKGIYAVKCNCCSKWVTPMFMDHVRVPGFDETMHKFEREDLTNPKYRISEAYVSCPSCHGVITIANLADPEKRRWIYERPEVEYVGRLVQPFDVPTINPPSRTLLSLLDYDRRADWVNFKVGQPHEDSENSVLLDSIVAYTTLKAVAPIDDTSRVANGCGIGIDVGPTSWITIGKNVGFGKQVLWRERCSVRLLVSRVATLRKIYGLQMCVIDAQPETEVARQVVELFPANKAFAAYYVPKMKDLSMYTTSEEDRYVNINRTPYISEVVKRLNGGVYQLPKDAEQTAASEHYRNIKKVATDSDSGDKVEKWEKTGDDHFMHSLVYLDLALKMMGGGVGSSGGVLPNISGVKLKV